MFATLLLSLLSFAATHAEGTRELPWGMIPVLALGEVAGRVSGQNLRIEEVGHTTQITVPQTHESYGVPDNVEETIAALCLEDTLSSFRKEFYRCVAR